MTVQSAFPFVADSGVPCAAEAADVVPVLWPASVLLLAEPLQPAVPAHSTRASAATSSVEELPRSTEFDVPQPAAAAQCDVLLPCRRASPVPAPAVSVASSIAARVAAQRASGRSVPDPVLLLSQVPPAVSQRASATDRPAKLSTPHLPVHAADAAVLRSAGLAAPDTGGVAASRSGPVLSLRQVPPPALQDAAAPSGVAMLC